jgi:hypothetical protein
MMLGSAETAPSGGQAGADVASDYLIARCRPATGCRELLCRLPVEQRRHHHPDQERNQQSQPDLPNGECAQPEVQWESLAADGAGEITGVRGEATGRALPHLSRHRKTKRRQRDCGATPARECLVVRRNLAQEWRPGKHAVPRSGPSPGVSGCAGAPRRSEQAFARRCPPAAPSGGCRAAPRARRRPRAPPV